MQWKKDEGKNEMWSLMSIYILKIINGYKNISL